MTTQQDDEIFDGRSRDVSLYHGSRMDGGTYQPRDGVCRGECSDHQSRFPHYYSCGNPVKVTRKVRDKDAIQEMGFCGIHDPIARKAKREKREMMQRIKRDAESAKWAEKSRIANSRPDYLDALRQIAAGHNDPRQLASEVLAKWCDDKCLTGE